MPRWAANRASIAGGSGRPVERQAASLWRFLSFLSGRHREIKARWTRYRRPGYQPASLAEQAADMRQVDALRRERQTLAGQDAAARRLFGGLWQGERSSWDDLEAYIRWVVEVRALCVRHGLEGETIEMASRPRPDVSPAVALREAAADASRTLAELRQRVGWSADYLEAAPFSEILDRVRALADGFHLAPRWAAFEKVRARAAAGLAAEALAATIKAEEPFSELPRALLRGFYQLWVGTVVQEREALRSFHTLTHEQRVEEFRQLDRRVLEQNRVRLVRQLRDRTQKRLQAPEATAGMPFLRREMARQRPLSPLRKTLRHAEAAVRAIKPCLLMSPLTVAQLLEGSRPAHLPERGDRQPHPGAAVRARGRRRLRGQGVNPIEARRVVEEILRHARGRRLDEAQRRTFERDVEAELTRHGIQLQPRVGAAGYRIDFGVLDETVPGRFLCGIECDGPTYGASETARDRDLLRQEVLAARGWTLLRVWSTDWFKDRAGQVERLLRRIEELRGRAREEAEARRVEEAAVAAASAPAEPAAPTPAVEPSAPAAAPYRPRKRYERADEFPPEEYLEAVLAVLHPGVSLDRKALTNEVRALFGFNRTGPRLQEAIGAAIDGLLRNEVVGDGSAGIRLRG